MDAESAVLVRIELEGLGDKVLGVASYLAAPVTME